MKKLASILSLAMLVGAAAYVSAENTPASKPATTESAPANGAINKFCAVEQDNPIDPDGKTYTYDGKVIGFCCPDCIDKFKENPEKYMATLK